MHTSPEAVAMFDRLRQLSAPRATLHHMVRTDLLQYARVSGLDTHLAETIAAALAAAPAPVLCTCPTLAPIASTVGALRIDIPILQAAARLGGRICLVTPPETACSQSLAGMGLALQRLEIGASVDLLLMPDGPGERLASNQMAYAQFICERVCRHLEDAPNTNVVALTHPAMDVALSLLRDAEVPVLSATETAFQAALAA